MTIPKDKMIELNISGYLHCRLCVNEWQAGAFPGQAMRDAARLSIGSTEAGFQVWCDRHDCNVAHIDLKGQKVDMYSGRLPHEGEQ